MVLATTRLRVDVHAAEAERARRALARRHLLDFGAYVYDWFIGARHLAYAAEKLEQVARFIETGGEEGIGRLLIFMPPRHGKTNLASILFPAWVLGRLPDTRVILTSYGASLAVDSSRAVRDIVGSDRYRAIFGDRSSKETPVALSEDSRASDAWELEHYRGGMTAVGVGGAITGKGAHLLILDDLFKNRDEADSPNHRERLWKWWQSSAYTRLEDGGAVVGMTTRWHPDDWAGRLLKLMVEDPLADTYEVISLPALAEPPFSEEDFEAARAQALRDGVWLDAADELGRAPGEALWPEKYSAEALHSIHANIGTYEWTALYQQQPYKREGGFFRREWFAIVDSPPKPEEILRRVRYWDKAGGRTRRTGRDYTAGVLMTLTKDGVYYVEHVAHRRIAAAERNAWMVSIGRVDALRPGARVVTWHQQDPGTAGVDSAQHTNRQFAAAGLRAQFETVSGSKEVRAGPWASMCMAGSVRLVRGGWNDDFIEQHVAFPNGAHDDMVDAAASAFAKLARATSRESRIW